MVLNTMINLVHEVDISKVTEINKNNKKNTSRLTNLFIKTVFELAAPSKGK